MWNKTTPLRQEDTHRNPRKRTLPADGATCTDPAHVVVMDAEVTESDERQIRQNARPLHTHKQREEGARQETAADIGSADVLDKQDVVKQRVI